MLRPLLAGLFAGTLALAAPARADILPPPESELGATREATGTGAELAFVKEIFREIQPWSIAQNREICGYIGYDRAGRLMRSVHSVGAEASCRLPDWPRKMVVIASYHTHSTYSRNFDSEVPSSTDLESDRSSGVDGYVATPGGRLWFVDSDRMVAGQICGIGCLPMDPGFVAGPKGSVWEVYSLAQILKREAGFGR